MIMSQYISSKPHKDDILRAYHELYRTHPHNLLPLETELPVELRPEFRDKYRVVMTMMLSGRTGDKRLTKCLGGLFKRHPNFESFRNFPKHQVKLLLGKGKDGGIGLGLTDLCSGGNGARFWSFLQCYFGPWKETITLEGVRDLYRSTGFGAAFVKKLEAYCLGSKDVLPLDRPAFEALRSTPLYENAANANEVRKDIEDKLRGESGVSLIDFHEMLRFIEQYTGKSPKRQVDIIVGWNAWRLLCSTEREQITKDDKCICEDLVRDKNIAEKLLDFYRKVAD